MVAIKIKNRMLGFALLWGLLLVPTLVLPAAAQGSQVDTLTIKVGYFGGPYYEKAVFTLDDLRPMGVNGEYTFIDRMPAVGIAHVTGVRLSDLMSAAGIDVGSIRNFSFRTLDGVGTDTSRTKSSLIDTLRYCYYSLPDNYDDEEQTINEYAGLYAVPVETMIAWAEDWRRCIQGATFGSDYLNLDESYRFRLIYGQTKPDDITASEEYYWIYEIVVELGGAPTLTLDNSVLEGEVGSVLRTQASISADSAVLANEPVTWSTSDESIATVDADGNITVHGEGTAVITAAFAGVTASVTVNGKPGEGEAPASPEEPEPNGTESPMDPVTGNPGSVDTPGNPTYREDPTAPDTSSEGEASETPEEGQEKPSVVTPADTPDAVQQLLVPMTITQTQEGGVQNWRTEEMSKTATALPDIEVDGSALLALGVSAGILFLGAGAVYAVLFYRGVSPGRGRAGRK